MPPIRNSGVVRAHSHFTTFCRWLQSPFLLAIRLYWGWQFTQTGWGKIQHIHHVVQFFAGLGIPHPGLLAPFVAWLEFIGGILLILGLVSRITSLALVIDMFVAYLTADSAALHAIFKDPGTFYGADPFTFFFAALIIFIFGAGVFSLDTLLSLDPGSGRSKSLTAR